VYDHDVRRRHRLGLAILLALGCSSGSGGNGGHGGSAGTSGSAGVGGTLSTSGRGGGVGNTTGRSGSGGVAGCGGPSGAGNATGGFCGTCPAWMPPDAPDGGYSPSGPDGGRITNDKVGCPYTQCDVGNTVPVAADDRSLGFSAADLLTMFSATGDLIWYDGTVTRLHVSARYEQLSVFVQQGPGTPGTRCPQMLANGAVFTVSTDDGRFAGDEITGSIWAIGEAGRDLMVFPSLDLLLPLSTLRGSFAPPATWQADGTTGSLSFTFEPPSDTCNGNCAPSPPASDLLWSSAASVCGYDGKIFAILPPAAGSPTVCTRGTVVATWIWR
jgi:hypothetical protein